MSLRIVLGVLLLIAGVCCFVLTWRSIAWMVDGGLRDYLQLAALLVGILTAMVGLWLMFNKCLLMILARRASRR